jgi:hypothetical protein
MLAQCRLMSGVLVSGHNCSADLQVPRIRRLEEQMTMIRHTQPL